MKYSLANDKEYRIWIANIKARVHSAQIKAAVKVNTELLDLYWGLGRDIVEKQKKSKWGDGLLSQLSKDLIVEFPDIKGFSISNLKYVKQWFLFYSQATVIGQQAVGQLPKQVVSQITQIPWGHNIAIIAKCKNLSRFPNIN